MTPERVIEIRSALGLSQAGLAEALRTSERTVRRWERDEVPVTGIAIVALELLEERRRDQKNTG